MPQPEEHGWTVPVRLSQTERDREALRAANGYDVAQERATCVVVLAALVLMVLLVVRIAMG